MKTFLAIVILTGLAWSALCPPSVYISGGGSPEVTGIYSPRGTSAGKMFYKISTDASDEPFGQGVFWDGGIPNSWSITDADSTVMYYSLEDVQYPWQVETWTEYNGVTPPPNVSQQNISKGKK
jgi:hypothetical protein